MMEPHNYLQSTSALHLCILWVWAPSPELDFSTTAVCSPGWFSLATDNYPCEAEHLQGTSVISTLMANWLSTWHTQEERGSVEELTYQNGPWTCLWSILLFDNWCRSAQSTEGGAITMKTALGYILKITVMGSRPERATSQAVFRHGFCFKLLPCFCLNFTWWKKGSLWYEPKPFLHKVSVWL